MEINQTKFEDLYTIEPKIFFDKRGYFLETFNTAEFEKNKLFYKFVQDNQSKSKYGVIRGLHYQIEPFAQTKLVRVLHGKILDIAVDIRTNSKTFGQHYAITLSDTNFKQLLIPKGFAHGFSVLSEIAIVAYKCDNFYNKNTEKTIIFNDEKLNIDWKVPVNKQIISDKDSNAPNFEIAEKF